MAKKRGLGRGLDSLLGVKEEIESSQQVEKIQEGLLQLPVDQIQRGRYQPRRVFDKQALSELAESIKSQGLLQPIVVRSVSDDTYEIIAGERRWRAAQLAGLAEIPVVIKDIPDETAIAVALIENIQREDLNPMEEAVALLRLQQEFNLTHDEVASAVGKSRSTVTNFLRLNSLQEEVRQFLESRQLDMGHAKALLALEGSVQIKAAKEIVSKRLSVRQAEMLVRSMQKPKAKKTEPSRDADIQALEQSLADKLGASVRISHKASGKGDMRIHYNSTDELQGILKHLGI